MKSFVVLVTVLAAMASASAVSMSRVGSFSLSGEGNTSGITYVGGSTYYVIDDKTEQLTKYTITLSDAGAIQSVTVGASVATGLKDAEGCAYDPGSGRVWVSYGCGTGVTHREKYFAELPAKDDTEFGQFWKRITWPQAHGFYKEKSHLPYETFDFIVANVSG